MKNVYSYSEWYYSDVQSKVTATNFHCQEAILTVTATFAVPLNLSLKTFILGYEDVCGGAVLC